MIDAPKEFGDTRKKKKKREREMTFLMKALRFRDQMGLAQGQWQNSDQNPHFLTSRQVLLKQSWFSAFPEYGSWVHRGFLVPLGMS